MKTIDQIMRNKTNLLFIAVLAIHLLQTLSTAAQTQWTDDGTGYYDFSKDGVVVINLLNPQKKRYFLQQKTLPPLDKVRHWKFKASSYLLIKTPCFFL